MKPAEDEMEDLLDDVDGTWVLAVDDSSSGADGTLESWCVRFFDPPVDSIDYLRGDANSSGTFSALSDALILLRFGFVTGSPAPACDEAADANNSGSVSPLADALFILRAAFDPDEPLPDAPYPDCGQTDDDDDEDLGCDDPPSGCA